MSTGPAEDAVPTMECRVCQTEVPAGQFCGLCGAFLTPQRRSGPDWLRVKAYGAARGERLLQPALASSLFPRLPTGSRTPFRVGLMVLLAALVVCALLRMPAALITVGVLGLPLLFGIYLHETDAFRDLPGRLLLLTAGLGVLLGCGWVLLTGASVARSYNVGLGTGVTVNRVMRDGLGVSLASLLLMLAPVVVVRLLRPPRRESLDGFAFGALGALAFAAATTMTRLAPQFAVGMVARQRPMPSLLAEAGIRGVAMPLTAIAVGGLVGAALWFARPADKTHQHPEYVRIAMVVGAAIVVTVYAAFGLIDVARVPQLLQLAVHLTVAMLALLMLRIGLHLALLHETHDEIQADEPVLCPHCGHVIPDMAFCPACGVATRASSQSSRALRRQTRPVRLEPGQDTS